MKFKEFVDTYYFNKDSYKNSTIFFVIFLMNLLFFISASLWLYSLLGVTNDLLQKENVINNYNEFGEYDIEVSYIEGQVDVITYYRELVILVPKSMYFYFAIALLSILFWLEFSISLTRAYLKYNNKGRFND